EIWLEVRIGSREDTFVRLDRTVDVGIEVQGLPIPILILERDVAVLLDRGGGGLRRQKRPSEFGSECQRGRDLSPGARILERSNDFAGCPHLRRGKASGTVGAFAFEHRGIELAPR